MHDVDEVDRPITPQDGFQIKGSLSVTLGKRAVDRRKFAEDILADTIAYIARSKAPADEVRDWMSVTIRVRYIWYVICAGIEGGHGNSSILASPSPLLHVAVLGHLVHPIFYFPSGGLDELCVISVFLS